MVLVLLHTGNTQEAPEKNFRVNDIERKEMKVKKLIRKMYKAILEHNMSNEKKLYKKLLRKSLKGKNTTPIR